MNIGGLERKVRKQRRIRDTYFVTDRDTRHETHWRRCGVCGSTQARNMLLGLYGPCTFRAIHQRALEALAAKEG